MKQTEIQADRERKHKLSRRGQSKSSEKCIHGREKNMCCECSYGKIRMGSKHHFNTVNEFSSIGYGYKLMAGFSLINPDMPFDEY